MNSSIRFCSPRSQLLGFLAAFAWQLACCEFAHSQVRFNDQIRPLLSDKCFFCHGPDEAKRESGLRLDVREDAIAAGAIQLDPIDQSELLRRIQSDDPEVQMPPPSSKLERYTDDEIKLLKQWISEGAKYERHWSFEPLEFQKHSTNNLSEYVDTLIRKKLLDKGIQPQPRADKKTLARRAAFDVTGLPPDRESVDSFVSNDNPDAWEHYIDRLLASQHFGEKMAVDWLDIARYADSFGFQVDRDISMWPWRDWVIRSFNDNKPFDQFIVEQLAGDMLPNASQDQILATAFNRLHQQETEGGSIEEEYRVEYVCDRVQTYATAFLGLTFECARCHDHKFDPIAQREYYQLFSIFQNIDEAGLYSYFTDAQPTPTLGLVTDSQKAELEAKASEVAVLEERLRSTILSKSSDVATDSQWRRWADQHRQSRLNQDSQETSLPPRSPEVRASIGVRPPILSLSMDSLDGNKLADRYELEKNATNEGANFLAEGKVGKSLQFTGDDAVRTSVGNFSRHQPFSLSLWIHPAQSMERAVIAHRSRAWTDAGSRGYELLIEDGKLKWSLIHFWPGNAASVRTLDTLAVQQWSHIAVTYDGSSRAAGLKIFVDGKEAKTEVIRDHLTRTINGGGGDFIDLGERFRDRGFRDSRIDELEVFTHALTPWEVHCLQNADDPFHLLSDSNDSLPDLVQALLKQHLIAVDDLEIQKTREHIHELRARFFSLQDSVTEIMAMKEMTEPKPAFILERGEYNRQGAPVQPGIPKALVSNEQDPLAPDTNPRRVTNRLELARWTVSRDNPLTSRVIVNRIWQSVFGKGLVKTSEDFGSQGSRPEYPEVLDALSTRFVENGWNTKELIKAILMSETYQQQSFSTTQQMLDDPDNELLARGPRFRLPAEMIRDQFLATSGLLNAQIGGPSVAPYELTESFKPLTPSGGDAVYRRSIYTHWRRTGPPPALVAFDAPRRAVCVAKRERTDSPLQSLVLLNGTQFVEAARAMADRIALASGEPEQWIQLCFERAIGREPDSKELEICMKLLEEQEALFAKDLESAKQLLEMGRYSCKSGLAPEKMASLTILCQSLLSHDFSLVKR